MRRRYLGGIALVAVLAALMVLAVVPKAYGQTAKCFGKAATIEGTQGPDTIPGTFGSDVIVSFAGQDLVRGDADFSGTPEGGKDFICLGKGDDTADGADKTDRIKGGPGDDTLDGDNFPSTFRDFLYGQTGDDTFTGGQGGDVIRGSSGGDTIDVGQGTVNAGADNVKAGRGNDTINEAGDGAVDTIDCGLGLDTVIADANDKTMRCEMKTTP